MKCYQCKKENDFPFGVCTKCRRKNTKNINKKTMKINKQEIELYFIQFCFMKNRELLLKQYRKIYDVLLKKYLETYKEGKKMRQDLTSIEKKFLIEFR